ncbi:MAG: cupredoxin domain-containing protein [Euryarchaeota archaeon]|nr:cupredoxin domain-containing protein [Euryarchaeota archaeon]
MSKQKNAILVITLAGFLVISAAGLVSADSTFAMSFKDISTIIVTPNSGKPNEFTVDQGADVVINVTNDDKDLPHNLWFVEAPYNAYHTKNLNGGQSESVAFSASKAGTFGFLCNLHPSTMTGKMTVKATGGNTATDKKSPGFEAFAILGAAGIALVALRRRV